MEEWREYNYRLYDEGSQRAWHRVMIVRFDSFRFGNGSNSYSLNGTVQLDFDED